MDNPRIIITYFLFLPIIVLFTYLAFRVLKKKQKYSYVLSLFYICVVIGSTLNIIYVLIDIVLIVIILHGFTLFINFFALAFLYMVNRIILETSVVYTKEERLKYIISYGLIFGVGMIVLISFNAVSLNTQNQPKWNIFMFLFMVIVVSGFGIIPSLSSSFKILKQSSSKEFKSKFRYYYIGLCGLASVAYMIFFSNFLDNPTFRLIITIYSVANIIYLILMYYGLMRLKPKLQTEREK